jgi:hypothetical protein
MKHIDMRHAWIQQLRDQDTCNVVKVPGEENNSDFFTKLLGKQAYATHEATLMTDLSKM